MRTDDALSILNLATPGAIYSRSEIKAAYKKMMVIHHPDKDGGSVQMSQLINEAWATLKDFNEVEYRQAENSDDLAKKYQDAINAVVDLDGVQVEICGSWIWVTGDTKPHKDILKENHFRYSRGKGWYFTTAPRRRIRSNKTSIDDIREAHGSAVVKRTKPQLAA